MIIDLDAGALYVVGEDMKHHRIRTIDLIQKIVYDMEGNEYPYSTNPITVIIGEPT